MQNKLKIFSKCKIKGNKFFLKAKQLFFTANTTKTCQTAFFHAKPLKKAKFLKMSVEMPTLLDTKSTACFQKLLFDVTKRTHIRAIDRKLTDAVFMILCDGLRSENFSRLLAFYVCSLSLSFGPSSGCEAMPHWPLSLRRSRQHVEHSTDRQTRRQHCRHWLGLCGQGRISPIQKDQPQPTRWGNWHFFARSSATQLQHQPRIRM